MMRRMHANCRIVYQSGRRRTDHSQLERCDAKTGTIFMVKYQAVSRPVGFGGPKRALCARCSAARAEVSRG